MQRDRTRVGRCGAAAARPAWARPARPARRDQRERGQDEHPSNGSCVVHGCTACSSCSRTVACAPPQWEPPPRRAGTCPALSGARQRGVISDVRHRGHRASSATTSPSSDGHVRTRVSHRWGGRWTTAPPVRAMPDARSAPSWVLHGVGPGCSAGALRGGHEGRRWMSQVLVVDDEERVATCCAGCCPEGHSVTVPARRAGAREARADDIDLVLLDLGMPRCNGLQVLTTMRERGDTDAGDRALGGERGRHPGPGARPGGGRLRDQAVPHLGAAGARPSAPDA